MLYSDIAVACSCLHTQGIEQIYAGDLLYGGMA